MLTSLVLLVILLVPVTACADSIIGGDVEYSVVKGDTLELIGAKLGVDWRILVRDNRIDIRKPLKIGLRVRANTRKLIPKRVDNGIIVNIPDKMLYFFKDGTLAEAFPVGLGMPSWKTPTGNFSVIRKEAEPTWHVPQSIQKEMEMKGQPVQEIVPPGPDNPLGGYAIKTSMPAILIHETIWPTSVHQFRSHGCIRVLPDNINRLFKKVAINTPGEIIYEPVKIAISDEGRIFLEVNRDVYRKVKDLGKETRAVIEKLSLSERVDWAKVEKTVNEKSGIVEDITQ